MSGSNIYSTTSQRAASHISLWRMIQLEGMSKSFPLLRKHTQKSCRRMPFTFLGELQRKVQTISYSYHGVLLILYAHPSFAVPVQSLGLDFFILSGPPCTPVHIWPDNLAISVYLQHVSSDG
jgi:hypothetical protein